MGTGSGEARLDELRLLDELDWLEELIALDELNWLAELTALDELD